MSYGAGHIQNMITRLKENKALLASKRRKNNKDGLYEYTTEDIGPVIKLRKRDEEKLKLLRERVEKQKKAYKRFNVIFLICSVFLFFLFIFWINS